MSVETANLPHLAPSHPEGKPPGPPTPTDPSRRCHAHKKSGEQCRQAAIPGGRVCKKHGGSAPAVINKARIRLQMQTSQMAQNLIDMANDTSLDYKRPDVRLKAITEVLDRGGVGIKEEIDINVDPKPFESLLDKIAGIAQGKTRAESRREREVLDVEEVALPDTGSEESEERSSEVRSEEAEVSGIAKPWQ